MDARREAEFTAFVRDRWRDLVRVAVFLGADHAEAEELAQATLVRCYRKWHHVENAANTEAYVYRMLLNQLRDSRRTRWWRLRADVVADTPVADASEQVETSDAVHRALGELTPGQRDVVVLRYFVQLTETQTAAALSIAPGTVKSRLSRALDHLAGSPHLSEFARTELLKEQP